MTDAWLALFGLSPGGREKREGLKGVRERGGNLAVGSDFCLGLDMDGLAAFGAGGVGWEAFVVVAAVGAVVGLQRAREVEQENAGDEEGGEGPEGESDRGVAVVLGEDRHVPCRAI